jgi:DNA-binding NarL/FixJ family response regulator
MSLDVLLADDHMLFRQALKVLLEREGFSVRAEACDGLEAVRLAATLRPDIAVLDIAMPALNGLDAARQITKVSSGTRTIALTMYTEDHYVLGALRASMRGYVIKTQAAQDLVAAIRSVNNGEIYLSPGVSSAIIDGYLGRTAAPASDPLTARERQVLQLVAEGKTSKEIADILELGVKSVESYRTRIMQKLEIHNTAGLVRYAIRQGLVQP